MWLVVGRWFQIGRFVMQDYRVCKYRWGFRGVMRVVDFLKGSHGVTA